MLLRHDSALPVTGVGVEPIGFEGQVILRTPRPLRPRNAISASPCPSSVGRSA